MATYVLGNVATLRAVFWDGSISVTPNPVANTLATATPHGLADGATVAFLGAAVGGLPATDADGFARVYYVVGATANAFQVAYTAGGTPIPLVGATPGVASALADPTAVACTVTTPDGAAHSLTAAKEAPGAWAADYPTAMLGAHEYAFAGTGAVVATARGSFFVV